MAHYAVCLNIVDNIYAKEGNHNSFLQHKITNKCNTGIYLKLFYYDSSRCFVMSLGAALTSNVTKNYNSSSKSSGWPMSGRF